MGAGIPPGSLSLLHDCANLMHSGSILVVQLEPFWELFDCSLLLPAPHERNNDDDDGEDSEGLS